MSLNENTTGAEAYLTMYIDNNFKEKDGLKSEQDQEAWVHVKDVFSHTQRIYYFFQSKNENWNSNVHSPCFLCVFLVILFLYCIQ